MSDQPPDPQYPPDPYTPPPAGGYPPPPPPGYPAPAAPAPGYPSSQPPKSGASGFAIAALIVAIIALVICWIPFVGAFVALVALVLGIAAWLTSKSSGRPVGLAVAATAVGALALLAGIVLTILLVWVLNEFGDDIRDCSNPTLTDQQQQECLEDRINDRFGIESTP